MARNKQYNLIGKLLDKAPAISTTWYNGSDHMRPLHYLIQAEERDLVQRLLKEHKVSIIDKDKKGDTPFSMVVRNYLSSDGNNQIIEREFLTFFIQYADFSQYPTTDLFLLLAKLQDRDAQIVEKILRRCKVEQLDSLLYDAVANDNYGMCQGK